jgi:hypothetical protein
VTTRDLQKSRKYVCAYNCLSGCLRLLVVKCAKRFGGEFAAGAPACFLAVGAHKF